MAHRPSPSRRGEKFLQPDEERRYRTSKRYGTSDFYGRGRALNFTDTRLANIRIKLDSFSDETIVDAHGVDFITDVIPRTIERVRQEHPHRKVRILDSGAGLGLFADQVRHVFGDDVVMFGTGLGRSESIQKKRDLLERIRHDQLIGLTPDQKQYILEFARDDIHPNDTKWTGLLDLHNFEEFDLIIDTYGEIFYAEYQKDFERLLGAALLKLRPGGQLYVIKHPESYWERVKEHIEQIKESYHVDFQWTEKGAVFTKLTIGPVSQTDGREG